MSSLKWAVGESGAVVPSVELAKSTILWIGVENLSKEFLDGILVNEGLMQVCCVTWESSVTVDVNSLIASRVCVGDSWKDTVCFFWM